MTNITNTPLISIMMPAYNADKFIQESINSIINQTYANWELIVVNDGSTDRTLEILNSIADNRIKIFTQKNRGEAVARNHALSKMSGEWAAFLDSDDLYEPEFLEQTINFLNQNENYDAVYTDGMYIDSTGKLLEPLSNHRRGPFTGDIFEEVVRASDVFGPPTCTLLNLKTIQDNKLYFDARIVIGPDWDFLTKFSESNTFGYINYYGVRYRVHETNITISTGSEKRRLSLSICRENQIKSNRFSELSLETQYYVFYDLLVNLIYDNPNLQNQTIHTSRFENLPNKHQAKLLRLVVNQAILFKVNNPFLSQWLKNSLRLNFFDIKSWFVFLSFLINKKFTHFLLTKKRTNQTKQTKNSPFNLKP